MTSLGLSEGVNTLRLRQNGRHFANGTFKQIFLNENVRIMIKISLKFVPKGPINNNPALAQLMAWHRPGDKPLSEPMIVRLPTHICVTRPRAQWGKVWVTEGFMAIIIQCLFFRYTGKYIYACVDIYICVISFLSYLFSENKTTTIFSRPT